MLINRLPRAWQPSEYDPLNIGWEYYFEAERDDVNYDDNDTPDPITDWSGNGRDAALVSGGCTFKVGIQNGLAAYLCSGDNYRTAQLGASITQPYHVFSVLRTQDVTNHAPFGGYNSTYAHTFYNIAGANTWSLWAGAGLTATVGDNTWKILDFVFDGVSSEVFDKGVSVVAGNAGANACRGMTLCNNSYGYDWTTYFSLVALYAGELTGSVKSNFIAYLAARYAI